MTTLDLFLVALLAVVAGLVLFRVAPVAQTYFRYRGKRLITCPETLTTEAVDVAARKAAACAFISESELCTDKCSGWPERSDCGQECLQQIEADPNNCLVWNIVSDWYEGQSCVYCHSRFEPLHYLDRAPALMGPDRKTVKWEDFRPELLPELFSTHKPVCWNCHLTQTCRRELQELVVDCRR